MLARVDGPINYYWLVVQIAFHVFALAAVTMFFSWTAVVIFLIGHVLAASGISIGYHRFLAHRASPVGPKLKFLFSLLGCLAFQGGPLMWVSAHRAHHEFDGSKGDPHSAERGFVWSHWKWLLYRTPNGFSMANFRKKCHDIIEDKQLMFLERNFLTINLVVMLLGVLILPFEIWIWIFPARIVFTWHVTWLINSYCHNNLPLIKTSAHPVNRHVLALISIGEGLHNNHHESPSSPKFSRSFGQLDFGWLIIKSLHLSRMIGNSRRTNRSIQEKVG